MSKYRTDSVMIKIVGRIFIHELKNYTFYSQVRNEIMEIIKANNFPSIDDFFKSCFLKSKSEYEQLQFKRIQEYDMIIAYVNVLIRTFLENKSYVKQDLLPKIGQVVFDTSCKKLYKDKFEKDMRNEMNNAEDRLYQLYLSIQDKIDISFEDFKTKVMPKLNIRF